MAYKDSEFDFWRLRVDGGRGEGVDETASFWNDWSIEDAVGVNPRATRSDDTAASYAILDRLRADKADGGVVPNPSGALVGKGDIACKGNDCEMNDDKGCCWCCGMAIGADGAPMAVASDDAFLARLAEQPGHMNGLPVRFSCRSMPCLCCR